MRLWAPVAALLIAGCYLDHQRSPDAAVRTSDAAVQPACSVEGAACDDADPCTRGDVCRGGRCVGETMRCEDVPVCHSAGECVAGACVYRPLSGAPCDDGDACTSGDVCVEGACVAEPLMCPPPDEPARCLDDERLAEVLPPGTCGAGECAYRAVERVCPDGCRDGACVCVATSWRSETVDAVGDVGRYNAIAIDAAGAVHVAYYEAPVAGNLRHAVRTPAGRWSVSPVDSAGDVGGSPSIAIDPAGRAHVVYDDLTSETLRYAVQTAAGWAVEDVDGGGRFWGGTVAVASDGRVHVAYTMETPAFETHLRYAERAPDGSWSRQTLRAGREVGLFPSLVIDALGGVHVVHLDGDARHLEHGYRASGSSDFELEPIGDEDVVGGNDVAVDRVGGLHVAYFTRRMDRLVHAYRAPDGTWTRTPVEGASHARWNVAIGVDPEDVVHLVFDSDQPDLFHAHRPPRGAWTIDRVASTGFSLSFLGGADLAIGPRGDVHVSHFDERARALRYASRRVCD